MSKLAKFIDNPYVVFRQPRVLDKMKWVSDATYLKLLYRARVGQKLNLDNPQSFNEKLQWLKLHDRNPLYTTLVDKYAVKQWVADKIGVEYVTKTYGCWESVDDIDLEALPEQFVLKTNHDCGGVAICRDRATFDFDAAKRLLNEHLHTNYFWRTREWPYKNVKPLVFAEEYLDPDAPSGDLYDYKLFRFTDGRLVTLAMTDRFTDGVLSKTFFDDEWHALSISEGDHPNRSDLAEPEAFEQMKSLADQLGESFPFVRVDFYESAGKLYFGEMTLYPNAGFEKFEPADWDVAFGTWIDLRSVGGGWLLVNDSFALWVHKGSSAPADSDLRDYKVMCFDGDPKLIQVHAGRYQGVHTQDIYDSSWNRTDITQAGLPMSPAPDEKPEFLDEILERSKTLSAGMAHVRVDWFMANGGLRFGEMTFYDAAGFDAFDDYADDLKLGSWIELSCGGGGSM